MTSRLQDAFHELLLAFQLEYRMAGVELRMDLPKQVYDQITSELKQRALGYYDSAGPTYKLMFNNGENSIRFDRIPEVKSLTLEDWNRLAAIRKDFKRILKLRRDIRAAGLGPIENPTVEPDTLQFLLDVIEKLEKT